MADATQVIDRPERHRFELPVDGEIAIAVYSRDGDVLIVTHTEVPEALERRGIGSALVRGMLARIRERGEKIVPLCPFVAAWIEKHPEEKDLVG